ncbi:zinc finger, C3HC4 type (RING finger) protein (macronuclear) [Tetrahymena thermophila SB210]|uniref:Zinc finger, C3HC4 type (RING finger) protein n=1 Tax=Tetrahymena thermophila (strain SB210) TaxID=312017 RepID=Q22RX6_TETTS|nr:zinc finger, C3HC4 type (RING finger) protein [Tetrahymena thermophila SB210]EAR87996.2 zinc finger, C3HC4 type (RING finger) protein [Tetrahymena thermophila SB210]|eukprot:XP_001008241.2 zinc finger, C3HC4 type (RING finger) protein [Tetrahymena thermophila SB210]
MIWILLFCLQISVAISQATPINLNQQLTIMQTQTLNQFSMSNVQQGYYYNINVKNINLSQNNIQSTLYLLVLVTSFQIDSTLVPQNVLSQYQSKYYMDYDGFGTKSDQQIIKYYQQDNVNPIYVSIYLYDAFGQFASLDQSQIFASYTIQIEKHSTSNYCQYSCYNGACNQLYTSCTCLNSVNDFYFDSKCQLNAKAVYINDNLNESFSTQVQYYYVKITDFSQSYTLILNSKYSGNAFNFQLYNQTFNTYSIPNFLNNIYNFQSALTKQIIFSTDMIAKTAAANGNQPIIVILGLYNFQPSGQANFNIQFQYNLNVQLSDNMPNWAMYLFASLAVLGLLFMIFVIFSIIRAQFRGSNGRFVRVRNIFVTPEIIEKYMPAMFYKEIDLNKDEQEECTICLEGYKEEDKVRISICGHLYHQACIDQWLVAHTNCPYCRQELTEKELEVWLQKRIQDQIQKQQQKEVKDMIVQFLSSIDNNEQLKKILKNCHQEQKQKRSFLSISNNNANLKKAVPDASSIYSNQTAQINQIPNNNKNKNRKIDKSKKNNKLHSQSFNMDADLDVDFKNLMKENILNSLSSNRKGFNFQNNKQNIQSEDDYNLQSNILNNQNSQDNFNLLFKMKNQKTKGLNNNKTHIQYTQQNQVEATENYELDKIQEDLRESNMRQSILTQTQTNSNQNLQRKNFNKKFRNGSQASLKSIENNQITSAQNIENDLANYSDQVVVFQPQNKSIQKQKSQLKSQKNLENGGCSDMNISFGGIDIKQKQGSMQTIEDFSNGKGSQKTIKENSKKQINIMNDQIEQNSSLNNYQADQTHQSLKAFGNHEIQSNQQNHPKGQAREINDLDNQFSQQVD